MIRIALATVLIGVLGCGHPAPGGTAPQSHATAWHNRVGDGSRELKVMLRTAPDSAEKEYYRTNQSERRSADGRQMLIAMGAVTFGWVDTVTVDARSLAPSQEHLLLKGREIHLSYAGGVVTRTDQVGDSVPRTSTLHYDVTVFPFNELDVLIRSIPLAAGSTTIVPLYSEVTSELERDTVQVIAGPSSSQPGWTIRFADPAIVSTIVLDPATRQFTSYETRPRGRAMVMRRVP